MPPLSRPFHVADPAFGHAVAYDLASDILDQLVGVGGRFEREGRQQGLARCFFHHFQFIFSARHHRHPTCQDEEKKVDASGFDIASHSLLLFLNVFPNVQYAMLHDVSILCCQFSIRFLYRHYDDNLDVLVCWPFTSTIVGDKHLRQMPISYKFIQPVRLD